MHRTIPCLATLALAAGAIALTGCDQQEEMLEPTETVQDIANDPTPDANITPGDPTVPADQALDAANLESDPNLPLSRDNAQPE